MEITFCIPKPWGDEDQSFLRIIGMNSTPIVWRDVDWEYVKGRVGSYMDPQLYFQTYGLGFFEYFQLSEDIGAEPLPILNCGLDRKSVV